MYPYPAIDGANAASYPTSYYAFAAGGARFYMLDASWGDTNTGSATGGACGSHCAAYQVDHDAHWTLTSPEYTWLQQDLAAHPGGLKFAFFHYPLYTNNGTQVSDPYLDNLPGSTGSLEQLLQNNGVDLAFNGHAHRRVRARLVVRQQQRLSLRRSHAAGQRLTGLQLLEGHGQRHVGDGHAGQRQRRDLR